MFMTADHVCILTQILIEKCNLIIDVAMSLKMKQRKLGKNPEGPAREDSSATCQKIFQNVPDQHFFHASHGCLKFI